MPYSPHSYGENHSPNQTKGNNTRAILCMTIGNSRHTAYIFKITAILGTTLKAIVLAPYYIPPLPDSRHMEYILLMTNIFRNTPKAIILAPYYIHSWPTHATHDNNHSLNNANGNNTRFIRCLFVADPRHTAYILTITIILRSAHKATRMPNSDIQRTAADLFCFRRSLVFVEAFACFLKRSVVF